MNGLVKSKRGLATWALFFILGVTLVLNSSCERKAKVETDEQKASYAIGQQIGQNLKSQNIPVDAKVVAAGIEDTLGDKEPKLTKEQAQEALVKLQERMNQAAQKEAEKNLAEGKAFLEANRAKEGVVTTASGLQYQIIEAGKGAKPLANDMVRVHYRGTLTNGQQFDSSYDRGQPSEFRLNEVIAGWNEALQLLNVGSKAKLFIPPELAYGSSPRPGIPANSVLVFDVELLDIVKREQAQQAQPSQPAAKPRK
jgi:FKBP-type peptidyl-prolyl cis-trans isomerase FkpA/FKBP-type peptidyl-prolyl cis-trans isomerase FklB